MLATGAAYAGATANIGVGSSYVFRGIPQTTGAAVSGGIDYATDSGVYLGSWVSNVSFGGQEGDSAELDLYAGFSTKVGDIGLDVGAIGYIYTETSEGAGASPASNLDFLEVYAGTTVGPVSAKVYYSPDFGNLSKTGLYGTATATLPVSDSVSVFAQLGSTDIEDTDAYLDFSVGVTKTADAGLSFTLGAYGTKGRVFFALAPTTFGGNAPFDDEPKFVVSAKKTFDL